ncbi:MAG: aminotransferase class V-fold PLP-dependent enzyme [Bdellovibrionales bacterium]|nr:aminotransferase class V-fold PLP-dependent enzyme [Bdellovibrionales bacterium]
MSTSFEDIVRQEFSHIKSNYFNTAYFGPSPISSKQNVLNFLEKELDPSFYDYPTWFNIAEETRVLISKLLNCSPDNITHSTSVSDVNNTVANGIKFNKGDVISAINNDYPSNILPWMLKAKNDPHVDFQTLTLDHTDDVPTAEWISKKLSSKTKVFCISYVTFDTGKKVDLIQIGKLMKERNILFLVDATQALGGMPITQEELSFIDVLSCASYKWLLGPYGHAFAYFSDRAQEIIHHTNANWLTSPTSTNVNNLLEYTTETVPGARKYDRGQTSNMLVSSCLKGGIELLNKLGLDNIEQYNQTLRNHFLNNFHPEKYHLITPRSSTSNIVALREKNPLSSKLKEKLKEENIDVSVRQGNVRLSFHLFNTLDQVNHLLNVIN